jgi:hypothetical protein
MANTTYFGWVMPNSADLVTDLPADFNVFGQGVDTSMQFLLGGTTGQVLSKTSATNMAFTWINNDQGDITAVTAGTGISGGGTSGAVTITNSMATEITAKADLIVGTGNAAFDNLAVGTNGQVLTADSTVSPTGLKWATPASGGGMTLISTTTLSGASISLTSIPGTYKNLVIAIRNYLPGTNGEYVIGQFNSDTGTTYRDASYADATGAPDRANLTVSFEASSSVTNSTQNWTIYDYANTTAYKQAETISWNTNKTTTANMNFIRRMHLWYNTAAITSIQLKPSGGNFTSGTALLYGVS